MIGGYKNRDLWNYWYWYWDCALTLQAKEHSFRMTKSARTFRIFDSSTFNDLKAERNALQEKVLPRLRNLVRDIPPILAWARYAILQSNN